MLPFQWYMGYNALYLDESGFKYLTLTQNLGQVGELAFMLVVPVIVRRCGYRWAMVIGMLALASGLHDWTVPYLAAFGLSLLAAVSMSFVREERPQNGKM